MSYKSIVLNLDIDGVAAPVVKLAVGLAPFPRSQNRNKRGKTPIVALRMHRLVNSPAIDRDRRARARPWRYGLALPRLIFLGLPARGAR